MSKKKRIRIQQLTKVRSILQQEVNSTCPFCNNDDVGHFQIHHIDDQPDNNEMENLLLLCPSCHSKITKGDFSRDQVIATKTNLKHLNSIECASITVDPTNCSWEPYDTAEYSFKRIESEGYSNPLLNFSLINHSIRTILLLGIKLKVEYLYSGLSGLPQPQELKPIAKYHIALPKEGETTHYKLVNELEIPSGRAFKFQVEPYSEYLGTVCKIKDRVILRFTLEFSNGISLDVPEVFLNCKHGDDEAFELIMLT